MTVTTPHPVHPAKFSQPILDSLQALLIAEQRRLGRPIRVLDPLAGVGRVHTLARDGRVETYGIEIEPEWAACHDRTACTDSLAWMGSAALPPGDTGSIVPNLWRHDPAIPTIVGRFDVIACSPPYGNRLADSHNAKDDSTRHSYTHDLGRALTPGNSGNMPWGHRYWAWTAGLYRLMPNVLRPASGDDPGGLLLWNVSDFVKHKATVPAVTWHRGALYGAGWVETAPPRLVDTQRLRYGENHEARATHETILRMRPAP